MLLLKSSPSTLTTILSCHLSPPGTLTSISGMFLMKYHSIKVISNIGKYKLLVVFLARNLGYTLRSFWVPLKDLRRIFCDNQSVVKQTSQPGKSLENKAIGITYHFVCESYNMGAVVIYWMTGKENLADISTKNLSGPVFHKHQKSWCMIYIH